MPNNNEIPKTYQFRGMMIEKVSNIEKTLEKLEDGNSTSHDKIWKKIDKIDKRLTTLVIKVGIGGWVAGFVGGIVAMVIVNAVG